MDATISQVLGWVGLTLDYAIRVWAIGAVPENRRPGAAHAWLLIIFFIPIVGLIVFLSLGYQNAGRRREEIINEGKTEIFARQTELPELPARLEPPFGVRQLFELNLGQTGLPPTAGDVHDFYPDSVESIRRMAEIVDRAHESVNAEIYIVAWDNTTDVFFRALERAVQRGVTVRFLLDHLGSRPYPGFHELLKRLTAIGVDWHLAMPFLPLKGQWRRPDLRNHRKILVVDGVRAMMGSQNMIDPGYLKPKNVRAHRRWHDCMVDLTGPIVDHLQYVFAVDWYSETHELLVPQVHTAPHSVDSALQVIPSGPGWDTTPNLRLFTSMLYRADHRAVVVSPYFIPEESLLQAITTTAMRGVEVELYVSRKADQFIVHHAQRSYYAELLEAGVRIFAYPEPNILHTKYVTIDEEAAAFGSSNLDNRSFYLGYEVTLLGHGEEFVGQLEQVTATYREHCVEITEEEWKKRSLLSRYVDNAMRLTAALM